MKLLGRYRVVYRNDGEIEKGMYRKTPVMSGRTPWFVIFEKIPENTQAHIHKKKQKYFIMNFFLPIECFIKDSTARRNISLASSKIPLLSLIESHQKQNNWKWELSSDGNVRHCCHTWRSIFPQAKSPNICSLTHELRLTVA